MDELQKFIADARAKGWNDEKIKQTLTATGWQEVRVDAALSGLVLPAAAKADSREVSHLGRPSITALQAALQHVLLWLFTGTSTVMIGIVSIALLGGSGDSSSETLLTYIVLELITFIPFAFFHWRYVRQLRARPELMTGKVWSILTIVFHSIGTISAVISLALVLVLVHNSNTKSGVVASLTIGAMDALVLATYVLANFSKHLQSKLRLRYLQAFPALLFVIIASLGIAALLKVGPLRTDDQTRQNLVTVVQDVHTYADQHKALPTNIGQLPHQPRGVSYNSKSSNTFGVCATYRVDHGESSDYTASQQSDTYVDSSMFNGAAGYHCWTFYDDSLRNVFVNGLPVYQ